MATEVQVARHPGGRPTDYRPEYCEQAIELGKQGKSKAQIALVFDVSRATIDNWAAAHPEFFDAISRARDCALAWWEEAAQRGLIMREFNANLWSRSMAARFPADYREERRTEIVGADGGPLQTQQTIYVIQEAESKALESDLQGTV